MEVIVTPTGAIRFIYGDALRSLLDEGKAVVRRASHVEPAGADWQADLAPVGGPVLGPYRTRQEALDAECAWLAKWLRGGGR